METYSLQRKLAVPVTCLIVAGTIGFVAIAGWSVADSLYMTIITMSMVGYGETNDLTPHGRVFTSSLILISIVLMACWTAGITSFLVIGGDSVTVVSFPFHGTCSIPILSFSTIKTPLANGTAEKFTCPFEFVLPCKWRRMNRWVSSGRFGSWGTNQTSADAIG